MDIKLHIKRQENKDSRAYWEDHLIRTDNESATIATALRQVSEKTRIYSDGAGPYRPLVWECSCLQKKCGACAMVVNGYPCLACDKKLIDCGGDLVKIEPLRKFPVVCDLKTDRKAMEEMLIKHGVWLKDGASDKNDDIAFEASKCIRCGLCLEICPNYYPEGDFGGMAAMTSMSRILAKESPERKRESLVHYRKAVYNGCGKSLACRDVCPAGVNIESLMIKSNAVAIWKRRMQK